MARRRSTSGSLNAAQGGQWPRWSAASRLFWRPRVAGRDREEHGAAPLIRELDASEGEHELEAQERRARARRIAIRPGSTRRARRAWRCRRRRLRGRAGARGRSGHASQRDGERVVLLTPEGELLGIADAVVFDEPVDVAAVAPSLRYLVTIRLRAVTAA